MTLEQAIHKLTFQVASIYGLQDRGLLRPGYAADVVVFDAATVGAHEPEGAGALPPGCAAAGVLLRPPTGGPPGAGGGGGLPRRYAAADPALGRRALHDRERP